MLANQCLQGFCQADEAYRKRSVLQDFCNGIIWAKPLRIQPNALSDFVVGTEFFGIYPNALSHQERVVPYFLLALDCKPVCQLFNGQIHHVVQQREEFINIPICFDCQPWEVD